MMAREIKQFPMKNLIDISWLLISNEVNLNNNNNGNFICVFECTIVNLATYRQFTNAA